jgi:hypothetical protein
MNNQTKLKIFIWEGNGISDAYHDDGTLVVAARTAQEAREVMLADKRETERQQRLRNEELEAAAVAAGMPPGEDAAFHWRRADPNSMIAKMNEIDAKYPRMYDYSGWDGSEEALNREPDQVIELDEPKFIAFNGGGYD